MFIYVAKNFTAAYSGSVVRNVTCEQCGSAYHYRMVRRGQGTASAPYYIGQRSAERRAETAATQSLAAQLRRDVDPVPCPDCGWFQAKMVREFRRRRLRWLNWTAGIVGGLLVLVTVIYAMDATRGLERELKPGDRTVVTVMAALAAAALAGPLLLRHVLLARSDPNRAFPERPALIPGAPKAFRPGEESADATASNHDARGSAARGGPLAYQRQPPEVEPGGWVTVQLLGMPVPPQCCGCLRPTDRVTVYERDALVKVPLSLCPQCTSAYAARKLRWITGSIGAFALVATGVTYIPSVAREFNPTGQIALAAGAGLMGWLVGLVLANEHAKPMKFGRFDSKLNTLRIRFKNPDYAAAFVSYRPPPPAGTVTVPIPRPGAVAPLPRPARTGPARRL